MSTAHGVIVKDSQIEKSQDAPIWLGVVHDYLLKNNFVVPLEQCALVGWYFTNNHMISVQINTSKYLCLLRCTI